MFDHEAERKPALSTGLVAAALLGLGALGTTWWIAASSRAGRRAEPPRTPVAPSETSVAKLSNARAETAALVEAAAAGDVELAEDLLSRGADANGKDAKGRSALSAALAAGEVGLARKLLAAGAKPEEKTGGGRSDLHLAAAQDDEQLIELLVHAGARVDARAAELENATALHVAADTGRERAATALIRAGADIDAVDARGFTPLVHAALLARSRVAQLLIRSGADSRRVDARRRTPLHFAAAAGDEECVRALLSVHADARAVDELGWTPLHFAAVHGRANVVALLVQSGERALLDMRTARGATALHLAARSGEPRCVQALLDAGLDASARDESGRSARDFAPPDVDGEPWTRLGAPVEPPAERAPERQLLDAAERRPLLCVCTRQARASGEPRVLLDFALWEDGAAVLAAWSANNTREYVAGTFAPPEAECVLRDLEETGWLGADDSKVDRMHRDCVEVAVVRDGKLLRAAWDEVQHSDLAVDGQSRAALADGSSSWARARDVLRSARPRSTRAMSSVLVRGAFRGLSFEDGARAAWME